MRITHGLTSALVMTALAASHGPVFAQAGKKVTPPAPKAIVLGTKQLPGDFGKLGQTYTLGNNLPINITLTKAEYTVQPFSTSNGVIVPKADEKLLILHYTVHNPLAREQTFYARSLHFTAVDVRDVNHADAEIAVREGDKENVMIALKPAQKLAVQGVIVVPAAGLVPKLIVQRETSAPVIRYDLRGKVARLPQAVADPADTSGTTALATIPATSGAFVPLGNFDARLDSVSATTEVLNRQAPASGEKYLVATLTLKNPTSQPQALYGHHWNASLIDRDGEKTAYNQTMLKGSRDESVGSQIAPGEEVRVRVYFALPQKAEGKTLILSHTAGRAASFTLEATEAVASR